MKRNLNALLCLPVLCLPMTAQEASPAETEALVREAIAFAKTYGREVAIKERIQLAKSKGKDRNNYSYINSKTGQKEPKTSYIEV